MSARAHFVAHVLLVKLNSGNEDLTTAAFLMSSGRAKNSSTYGCLKKLFSKSISGDKNPAKRTEVRDKISKNNPMKSETHRITQREACLTEEVRSNRRAAVSGANNPSCSPKVKLKRAEDLKKRIREGTMNRGVDWTPETVARRTETKRMKREEAHARGEKYGAPKVHHTTTLEGRLKHIEAVKRGWITRKENQK